MDMTVDNFISAILGCLFLSGISFIIFEPDLWM